MTLFSFLVTRYIEEFLEVIKMLSSVANILSRAVKKYLGLF